MTLPKDQETGGSSKVGGNEMVGSLRSPMRGSSTDSNSRIFKFN